MRVRFGLSIKRDVKTIAKCKSDRICVLDSGCRLKEM
jgi:hypothetical protein